MLEKNHKTQLVIDPRGGIAGDMFSAALISGGADEQKMLQVMKRAAKKLGEAEIRTKTAADGSQQLQIELHANHHHLSAEKARQILTELYQELNIEDQYQALGLKILEILLHAEHKAHSEHTLLIKSHSHHQTIQLHEAQDIIIDIMGAISGLQQLAIEPRARLLYPVSVGAGYVEFSHGRLPVPAPATEIILNQHKIKWRKGPLEQELCTPTGASILAALQVELEEKLRLTAAEIMASGRARGSKILDIPPLEIFIVAGL